MLPKPVAEILSGSMLSAQFHEVKNGENTNSTVSNGIYREKQKAGQSVVINL